MKIQTKYPIACLARNCILSLGFLLVLPYCSPDKTTPAQKKTEESPKTVQSQSEKKPSQSDSAQKPQIYRTSIKGPITPSAMETLSSAIEQAESKKATALLLILDTPGGLVSSMDVMIRKILASKVPVLTYVSPPGASCGSAGVFLMYASHLTAMAPATNIGSATPVSVGTGGGKGKKDGDRIPETAGSDDSLNMKRKILNHTRSQIRSLAQFHGRNVKFGENTITRASNLTSNEAVKIQAVDLLASSEEEMIRLAHGRKVRMSSGRIQLNLKGAEFIVIKHDFRNRILDLISNPALAMILMMIGMIGLIAEIQNPGAIFPGAIGSVCLILGLYAVQTLPLDYTGLLLIGLSFIFFVLEIFVISYGLLSLGGIATMILGSLMLARSGSAFADLSLTFVLVVSSLTGIICFFLVYFATKSQSAKPMSGFAKLMQETGRSISEITLNSGNIHIHSEIWQARCRSSSVIPRETEVRVVDHDGLILFVEPVELEKSVTEKEGVEKDGLNPYK